MSLLRKEDKGGGMMERLTELKYYITKLDAKIENMQERIDKMAFDDKEEVGIKFLASTVSYLKELKEYKQLEEQGLLLRLPCKVGDTVYRISDGLHVRRKYIEKTKISRIAIDKDEIYVFCSCKPNAKRIFGVHVFQTAEEAKQKLKEMESD